MCSLPRHGAAAGKLVNKEFTVYFRDSAKMLKRRFGQPRALLTKVGRTVVTSVSRLPEVEREPPGFRRMLAVRPMNQGCHDLCLLPAAAEPPTSKVLRVMVERPPAVMPCLLKSLPERSRGQKVAIAAVVLPSGEQPDTCHVRLIRQSVGLISEAARPCASFSGRAGCWGSGRTVRIGCHGQKRAMAGS